MKWIGVKDKLPSKIDRQYICNCTHENDGELVIVLIWNGECWGENDYCDDIDWNKCVTHWIEMPKPFKTESLNKNNELDKIVSRPLFIRGTSPYSFRSGEWAVITDTQIMTPENLSERPVYILKYSDGYMDAIAISDTENYELG